MSPITHFLFGWMVANTGGLGRRDRALVAIAGVIPDVDGLGAPVEVLTKNWERPLAWFSEYHHTFHNITFAVVVTALAFAAATRRWKAALLAFLSFHLHLFCDVLGARGPDGHQWPIPYLKPFSDAWEITWSGQWALNAWPNFAITGALLIATFYLAWRRGFSPLEIVSPRADQAFVGTLHERFPRPAVSG
jgi:membrane-bound metal-dependent hydrolase YbcI (DUF457 family)